MPKVSIVIPVYNAIDTIERCVNSVLNQTLFDIEAILVDDASSDGSALILERLDATHKRVKLIKNEKNSSASICRKKGVELASGEYIMFLDADDVLSKDACEVAYREVVKRNVDILQFGVEIKQSGATEGQIKWFDNFVNSRPDGQVKGGLLRSCFSEKKFGFTLWNKIYRKRVAKLASQKMPDVPVYKAQDLLLQYYILIYAATYDSINNKLYTYSYGSGITGGFSFTKDKIAKHFSQSMVACEILHHGSKYSYLTKYRECYLEIVRGLLIDNLVTLRKCIDTEYEFFALNRFFESWSLDLIKDKIGADGSGLEVVDIVFSEMSAKKDFSFLSRTAKDIDWNIYFEGKLSKFKGDIANGIKSIPVVMATNDKYLPYLAVAIDSIKACTSSKISLFVFYTDLQLTLIDRVKKMGDERCSIEFIDVSHLIEVEELYSRAHYSVEMYYRLLIAEIFDFTDKVIYLDCDIICKGDLTELYACDLNGYVIAAARNPVHRGMLSYLNKKLDFPYKKYFNSGVILVNTRLFKERAVKNQCLGFIATHADLACPDQDALNVCCIDQVKYIPQSWNFQWHHIIASSSRNPGFTPLLDDEANEYEEALNDVKIIHYTSNVKPWNSPSQKLSVHFWEQAKNGSFFFDVLSSNIN